MWFIFPTLIVRGSSSPRFLSNPAFARLAVVEIYEILRARRPLTFPNGEVAPPDVVPRLSRDKDTSSNTYRRVFALLRTRTLILSYANTIRNRGGWTPAPPYPNSGTKIMIYPGDDRHTYRKTNIEIGEVCDEACYSKKYIFESLFFLFGR